MGYRSVWLGLGDSLSQVLEANGTEADLRQALFDATIPARGVIDDGSMSELTAEWWGPEAAIDYVRDLVELNKPRGTSVLPGFHIIEHAGSGHLLRHRIAKSIGLNRAALDNLWPAAGSENASRKSGVAGRPTSIALVLAEHDQRLKAGHALPKVKDEAAALVEWLKTAHPREPQLTAKTIKNRIATARQKAFPTG